MVKVDVSIDEMVINSNIAVDMNSDEYNSVIGLCRELVHSTGTIMNVIIDKKHANAKELIELRAKYDSAKQ